MPPEMRVLVVDDSQDTADRIRAGIDGAVVDTETNTTAATKRLDEGGHDAVVSDYHMAGGDGLELLETVRGRYGDLPFIIFTETGSEAVASRAIGAGVTDYILKTDPDATRRLLDSLRSSVTRRRAITEIDRQDSGTRFIVDQELVGVLVIQDGLFRYVNDRFANILGYDAGEVADTLGPADIVDESDLPMVQNRISQRVEGELDDVQYSFTAIRKDGQRRRVEVFGGTIEYEGEPAVLGFLLPESADRRRERGLAALGDATQDLMAARTREDVLDIAVAATRSVLEREFGAVYRRRDDGFEPAATTPGFEALFDGSPPTITDDSSLGRVDGGVYRFGEADQVCEAFGSGVVASLGRHGVYVVGAREPGAFDEPSLDLVELLAVSVETGLDRTDHEHRLEALVASTQRLEAATRPDAVADVAIETAREVLGHEFCSIHVPEGDKLVPVAATEAGKRLFGPVPDLGTESLAWDAFQRGELMQFGDVRESGPANPDTPIRSELLIPLGDQGVFVVGATVTDAFDRTDVRLAELFGASVRAALERAQREATVAHQNEQLEEFAGVVSHDLRNPLGVAMGRLEMAMESNDDPNLPIVERSLDRMEALINDLLTLARQGQTLAEVESVALEPLARDVWRTQDAPDATLEVEDDLPTVDGDAGRLRQLFENLFGNALRHAGDDVTVRVGTLDRGFYVADDGPGIPVDERETVLESGYTTNRVGTGFGLAIVRSIAGAHGFSVTVTESEAGGAQFEFTR